MLPQPIEIQRKELKNPINEKSEKRPNSYPKSKEKKNLSPELEEGSLSALKELLAKHKNEEVILQALPFSNPQFLELQTTSSFVSRIEPSGQVLGLYEKLIESIVIVHNEGIQETTFFLDGDAFSTSIFQGAKITITEYSTAPKVFNIQFSASSNAVNFFQQHASDLLIALQKEHFGFSVNRLDTSLTSEDERHSVQKVKRDLEKEDHT